MALVWHTVLSLALIPQRGFEGPNDWFDEATDTQVLEKVLVLSAIGSPWVNTFQAVAESPQYHATEDAPERTPLREQVVAVTAHINEHENAVADGHCVEWERSERSNRDYSTPLNHG